MRERGVALLLALAALVAFYALWLRPAPSLDLDADDARPTSAERRGNGYAGLSNGCSAPASACAPGASVTPRSPISTFRRAAIS